MGIEHTSKFKSSDGVYVQERVSPASILTWSASGLTSAPRTSYDRYYEGRKAFGAISSQVRTLAYAHIKSF